MTSKAALFALFALWGMGDIAVLPVFGDDDVSIEQSDSATIKRGLINRPWALSQSGDLPGIVRVFLSDGTLVSDTPWGAHRMSHWTMTSGAGFSWIEDGREVVGEIASVSATELVLHIQRAGGIVEERYTTPAA